LLHRHEHGRYGEDSEPGQDEPEDRDRVRIRDLDGDGITAPEVIRDVHLIPGFWKVDGYTKMLRYIEETFDVASRR
jgi:hypothetical protein